MAVRRSALLIATDRYTDVALKKLHAPAGDIRSLRDVLTDRQIGGYDVWEPLYNAPYHRIKEVMEEFCANRARAELLLLYFSCHGLVDERGSLYLAATDTKKQLLASTAVSARFVNERMRRTRADQVVLVLDCCNGGAFGTDVRVKHGGDIHLREMFKPGRGRVVMAASRALEFAFDGNALDGDDARSVFTAAIVDGLSSGEADLDRDGRVSDRDLFDYVSTRVEQERPEQTPCRYDFAVSGHIVLAESASAAPLRAPAAVAPVRPPAADPGAWIALQHEMPAVAQASAAVKQRWAEAEAAEGEARVKPLVALAMALVPANELPAAEMALRAALAFHSDPTGADDVQLQLARVLGKRGRIEEAGTQYRAVIGGKTARRQEAWHELGALLAKHGDRRGAVEVWREAAGKGVADAWIWLGDLHERHREWPAAVEAFEQAATAGNLQGLRKLASLHEKRGSHAEQTLALERLIARLDDRQARRVYADLASAAERAGMVSKAADAYTKAAEGGDTGAWVKLGEMYERIGDRSGAVLAYGKAATASRGARFNWSKRRVAKRAEAGLARLAQSG